MEPIVCYQYMTWTWFRNQPKHEGKYKFIIAQHPPGDLANLWVAMSCGVRENDPPILTSIWKIKFKQ